VTGNATGDNPRFGSWRIYDRATRPKTHVWIYRARHDGFNTNWWNSGGLSPEPSSPEELTLGQHQHIGRAMINAFFQDAFGDGRYNGYLTGPVRPQGLYAFEIFPQHHAPDPEVVDDFGDAAGALDKTTNVEGQAVAPDGGQLVLWEDVEHVTLAHSVHDTKSTDLEWNGPDAGYSSPIGSVTVPGAGVLSLRVAQFYDENGMGDPMPPTNPEGVPADLFLELVTSGGRATVRIGVVGEIPYPYPRNPALSVMRTVRIPLDAVEAVAPGGTLGTIVAVRVWMAARPTGQVLVDDLEFTL
jgi:hypothetical protein